MSFYSIELSAKATEWLEDCLDAKLRRRLGRAIDALGSNPRPVGSVKLAGEEKVWRVRVGDYRILYDFINQSGHERVHCPISIHDFGRRSGSEAG